MQKRNGEPIQSPDYIVTDVPTPTSNEDYGGDQMTRRERRFREKMAKKAVHNLLANREAVAVSALQQIEEWWVFQEMARQPGCPAPIFAVRAALKALGASNIGPDNKLKPGRTSPYAQQ